jgi:hypothetical protein
LLSGYDDGGWHGSGINSNSADALTQALGWRDDAAAKTIKIRLVRYGDADLNGAVNSMDFSAFMAGYAGHGIWATGDFNYDQKVTAVDFNLLAGNFGAAPTAPDLGTIVPEPSGAIATISLLCGWNMVSRGRRRYVRRLSERLGMPGLRRPVTDRVALWVGVRSGM